MIEPIQAWPEPPSYALIAAAVGGCPDAVNSVVQHYSGYIAALATRHGRDESGAVCPYVDDELYKRMETKLIIAILKFNLN